MADTITKKFFGRVAVDVTRGQRGMFDVKLDGELVFSKYTEHRFPDDAEILTAIEDRLA